MPRSILIGLGILVGPLLEAGPSASAQTPEVEAISKALTGSDADAPQAPTDPAVAPAEGVAEASGPIAVEETVTDEQVRDKLATLLPKYPGVVRIDVQVEDGVATLTGHVVDDQVRDRLLEFVRRVEGVHLVINQTRTDSQVLTGRQRAAQALGEYRDWIARTWLLALVALAAFAGSVLLSRLFRAYSDTLLTPFVGNVLLRSVAGSIIGGAIVLGGLFTALSILRLTEVVLSVLGLAGVVALAVGFAFRDIAENFIASVLLGLRRPFRVGDYVEVAGQAGVVRSLNTRATVLLTLEGNQVRIPNAMIFKEILVNKSASESVRGTFDLIVPFEASTTEAQEAISRSLRSHQGILDEPPPRALVEALEPSGVRLRTYYWTPSRGVDGFKLASDARLAAKVALQQAGIQPPTTSLIVDLRGAPSTAPISPADRRRTAKADERESRANLDQDRRAARDAAADPDTGDQVVQHVINAAGNGVSQEGQNLLDGKKDG